MLAVVALRLTAITFDLEPLSITGPAAWAQCQRTFRLRQESHTRFLGTDAIFT